MSVRGGGWKGKGKGKREKGFLGKGERKGGDPSEGNEIHSLISGISPPRREDR